MVSTKGYKTQGYQVKEEFKVKSENLILILHIMLKICNNHLDEVAELCEQQKINLDIFSQVESGIKTSTKKEIKL